MNEESSFRYNSIFPVALRYGLIGILLAAVYSMLLYFLGQHYNFGLAMAGLIFPILVISLGIHAYKSENGGQLTFTRGLLAGLMITLVYAVGVFIFTEIYTNWVVDNYWEGFSDKMEDMFERFGMSDEQIETQLAKLEKRQTIGSRISSAFLSSGIIGLIISLIAAAIMKTNKKEYE